MATADWLSDKEDWTLQAQYFELYQDQVRDLIVPSESSPLRSSPRVRYTQGDFFFRDDLSVLSLRNQSPCFCAVNATTRDIHSVQQVQELLFQGNRHRTRNLVSGSSKSHAFFRLIRKANDEEPVALLNFVDLAGPECHGLRRKDSGKINES